MKRKTSFLLAGGICALIVAMGIGRFAYTPILPLMKFSAGLSEDKTGYLASANYAGYLLGAAMSGLVKGHGKLRIFLNGSLIACILTLAGMGIADYYGTWLFLRFIAGAASGLIFVLSSSIVLDELARKGRSILSGIFYSGVGMGIFISGIIVPVSNHFVPWQGIWLVLSILSISLSVVVFISFNAAQLNEDENHAQQNTKMTTTHPILIWLIIAYGLEGLGYIVSGTFLVDMVRGIEGTGAISSLTWIIAGLAAIPSTYLWMALVNRLDYIKSLCTALIIQAVGIALPVMFQNPFGAILGAFLFGATFMGITAMATSYARMLQPSGSNRIIAILTVVYGLGQIIGPAGAGLLVHKSGNYSIAFVLASGILLLAVFLLAAGTLFTKKRERKMNYAIRKY
ncbi:YbfB/YjiJ family MFS transporter [Peribacillus glennii]|uniref:YbfB/YjiJ family MFS transporter n=1 Tax=Peribacillus glennii TaxID=2303991 RepID=A0A372L8E4_9BACI|nr:YbfB/YjiJ family MFS transporter [Peribacillus glennii]RFU61620.1 YbfB/YjiJ family MFS transporter [Peribacillus glennii]